MYHISQPRHTMESQTAQTSFKSLLCRLHKPKIDHTCIILSFTASENLGVSKSLENTRLCLNWSLFWRGFRARQRLQGSQYQVRCRKTNVSMRGLPRAFHQMRVRLYSFVFALPTCKYVLYCFIFYDYYIWLIFLNQLLKIHRCGFASASPNKALSFLKALEAPSPPPRWRLQRCKGGQRHPPGRSRSGCTQSCHMVLLLCPSCDSSSLPEVPSHMFKLVSVVHHHFEQNVQCQHTIFPLYMARSYTLRECSFISSWMWKN